MPPQARLGDKALIPADAHGCPACPHTATGPAVAGSRNVLVNDRPAIRVGDPGIHAACCGPNTWNAKTGSGSVLINGRAAHRLGDLTKHCGGIGRSIEGSGNVIVGDNCAGTKLIPELPLFRGGFTIVDKSSGAPLDGIRYRITKSDGSTIDGITDATGNTELITSDNADNIQIHILSKLYGDA